MRAVELAIIAELPEGRFVYLEALATRADARLRGHARAVLQPGLERAASEGVAAVLDADDEGVLSFYEKAGFERLAEVGSRGRPDRLGDGARAGRLADVEGVGVAALLEGVSVVACEVAGYCAGDVAGERGDRAAVVGRIQ